MYTKSCAETIIEDCTNERNHMLLFVGNRCSKTPESMHYSIGILKYKLVCQRGDDFGELYDLRKDPNESINLWDDHDYFSIKMKMLKRRCDRMAWTCDPLPGRITGY